MTYPTNLLKYGFDSRVVEPLGSCSNGVYFLGEAPGEVESASGIPFNHRAPAGGKLDRLLRMAGLGSDDRERPAYETAGFRVANCVWQRPPRNWLEGSSWEHEALATWRPFLEADIAATKPRCIVALGGVALAALTDFYNGILAARGYVFHSNVDVWTVATYHPSYLLPRRSAEGQAGQKNNSHLSGVLIFDIQRALEIARVGFARKPTRYVTHPTPDDLLAFERGYNPDQHFLSYDIETPESSELDEEAVEDQIEDISYDIVRASLCYDADSGYSLTIPWQEPFIAWFKRLMASSGPKRNWNGRLFDDPRLRSAGCAINGRIFDLMDAWKFTQPTLPKGLAFVAPFYYYTGEPWKHLSHIQPEFYSCVDAHVNQNNGDGIERSLRASGRWELYLAHRVEAIEVLTQMSNNGLPYSAEKAAEFEKKLEAMQQEREAQLQTMVPELVKPAKQKTGYKKTPKDTTGLAQREFRVPGTDLTDGEREGLTLFDPGMEYATKRWCVVEPFLPTSPKQVADLIRFYGHKLGRNHKTGAETTDKDTINALIRKYWDAKREQDRHAARTYRLVKECRQLSKVLGTYVKGWRPKADGRIHATPGFWGKMYRVSWRNPNIAATIADKDEEYIAAGFRECVATSDDYVLLESDWRSMEALLVGYFADDPDYMRLARLGVHDYMGLHMLGEPVSLSLPDEELRQRFRHFKANHKKLRDDAKHTIHGTNYVMEPLLMSMLYNMTVARAKELQALYFDLFPKVKQWQQRTMDQAWYEGKLTAPHGYVMSFWDVYDWNQRRYDSLRALWQRYRRDPEQHFLKAQREWLERLKAAVTAGLEAEQAIRRFCYDLGDDAKSAVSFLPRDTGAAMLVEVLLRLERKHALASKGYLIASTHDAVMTIQHRWEVERIAQIVKSEMEAPVKELGGLAIGVEQKVGQCWSDDAMEVYTPEVAQALVDEAVPF